MLIVTDFRGRSIRITAERLIHIHAEHPEMVGMEGAIRETLEVPDATRQSNSDPAVTLCYRWIESATRGSKYVCVVVKLLETDAFVSSARLARRIEGGKLDE